MITYVNNSNAQKYSVLFEKATQALVNAEIEAAKLDPATEVVFRVLDDDGNLVYNDEGLPQSADPIDRIEKYFYYLPQLLKLDGGMTTADISDPEGAYDILHSEGRRFTMIPIPARQTEDADVVSEYVFEVDADARSITIPKDFTTNGVAVQGDELAEVLYFRIDRYFDAMDLDTADHVFIQWTNANGDTGLSIPWVIDIQSEPNKIIIGWALSSDITEKSGNIQFALRFVKWDTARKNLTYSWSTQTSTIAVKSALDFQIEDASLYKSLTDQIQNAEKSIISRIKDTATTLTHSETVEYPVFIVNMEHSADGKNIVYNAAETKLYADLAYDEEAKKEIYKIQVEARSTDGGIITYSWKFTDKDGNAQVALLGSDDDASNSLVSIEFIPTQEGKDGATVSTSKVYYEKKDGAYYVRDVNALETGSDGNKKTPYSEGWYEKVAQCVVCTVGTFQAIATNTKVGVNSRDTLSELCEIPMPSDPVIETQIVDRVILTEAATTLAPASMSVGVTNHEANGTKEGTVTYEWFKMDTADDVNPAKTEGEFKSLGEPAVGANQKTFVYDADIATGSDDDKKTVEGTYKVVAYNTKNGQTVSTTSSTCRLTFAPEEPKLSFPKTADDTKVNFNTDADKRTIHVTVDEDWKKQWNISDSLEYRWYKSSNETVEDGDGIYDDVLLTVNDEDAKSATAAYYTPDKTGKYYCVVTNIKNGEAADYPSLLFYVTD